MNIQEGQRLACRSCDRTLHTAARNYALTSPRPMRIATITLQWVRANPMQATLVALTSGFVVSVLATNLARPIFTDDLWWHLKLGQLFIQQRGLPTAEPFLFTAGTASPFYHEWLFELAIALLHEFAGLRGLRLLHVVVGFVVLLVVWQWYRRCSLPPILVWAGLVVFVLFGYQRLAQLRPHLISILYFWCLLMIIIEPSRRFGWKRTISCLGLTILWANTHSLCMILFPFWALYIACGWTASRSADGEHFDARGHMIAFLAAFAVVSFNPRGYELYYFFFTTDSNIALTNVPDEWAHFELRRGIPFLPLSSPAMQVGFPVLVVGCAAGAVVAVRRLITARTGNDIGGVGQVRFELFVATAGLAACAMMAYAVRFFWMAPLPFAAAVLPLARWRGARSYLKGLAVIGLCTVVWLHFLHPVTRNFVLLPQAMIKDPRFWRENANWRKFHASAVQFLRNLDIGGNIYNPYYMGGYLAFYLSPRYRTFLDGRVDRYAAQVFFDFKALRRVQADFRDTLVKYPIDLFFVPMNDDTYRLRLALAAAGWTKIFHDYRTTVYLAPGLFARKENREALRRVYPELGDSSWRSAHHFETALDAFFVQLSFPTSPQEDWPDLYVEAWRHWLDFAIAHQLFDVADQLATMGVARWGRDWPVLRRLSISKKVRKEIQRIVEPKASRR